MAIRKKLKPIYIILLLALFLRLLFVNQSLWLDESIGAIAVKNFSYSAIVNTFLLADNHPPLYYLLLKFWSNIFGYSELALRSLSILFSLVAILYTYKFLKDIFKNKKAALYSAIFMAFSQFFVYFSQEARMYMPAAAITIFAVYYLYKTFEDNNYQNWIYLSLGLVCLFFIDYVPVFIYPTFIIIPLFNKVKFSWWKKFFISHIPLLVLGLLWLPIFTHQLNNSPYVISALPGWSDIAGGANLKEAALVWIKFTSGRISLVNKKLYYFFAIISSLPFLYAFSKIKFKKKTTEVLILFLTPIVLLFVSSFLFPSFIYFRLTFTYPLFAALISIILFSKQKSYPFIAISIVLIQILSLFIYYTDTNQQREQWRQAVSYIEAVASPEDIVLFEYSQPFSPYRWYESGELETEGAFVKVNANSDGTVERINSLIEDKNKIYHFEYLGDLSDRNKILETELEKAGFKKYSENANFVGIGKINEWHR